MALYSKKSPQNSDSDVVDESEGEALIVKSFISRNDTKSSGLKRFQSKIDIIASKGYETGRKSAAENKEGPKCFQCGGADQFAMECKSNRVDTNEDYEAKYKKLLSPLKRQNIDVRILVADVENWVGNEESSGEDGGNDEQPPHGSKGSPPFTGPSTSMLPPPPPLPSVYHDTDTIGVDVEGEQYLPQGKPSDIETDEDDVPLSKKRKETIAPDVGVSKKKCKEHTIFEMENVGVFLSKCLGSMSDKITFNPLIECMKGEIPR
ncbi:unnamed protein product [Lactuca virosa]|uniref:Uncharacterized protein n=1 Tax=Lactuca virosa TaxID=75947 RepID=A0AAU9P5B4_9ASTR|nr:unnamed protein product [Lactuca virosa]